MSDNWVVQNLENALEVWNDKLSEIWMLITQSPQTFKGGSIWNVITNVHGALQAIGLALLVLFFVIGVMKTCGSFAELKRPEHAIKLFVRFAIAKGVVTYGMNLMLAFLEIIQGVISTIMNSAGFGSARMTAWTSTERNTTICSFPRRPEPTASCRRSTLRLPSTRKTLKRHVCTSTEWKRN